MIERSLAVKAPRVEYQLMGAKKFQQYLFETNTIETLLKDEDKAKAIRATFVNQYSFGKGEQDPKLIERMKIDYENIVIKPQLEGGGHNYFGLDIKLI
jgi:hypothetical protein